jgi:hypothetical protein
MDLERDAPKTVWRKMRQPQEGRDGASPNRFRAAVGTGAGDRQDLHDNA